MFTEDSGLALSKPRGSCLAMFFFSGPGLLRVSFVAHDHRTRGAIITNHIRMGIRDRQTAKQAGKQAGRQADR